MLEKLIVSKLLREFPTSYGRRKFNRILQERAGGLCYEPYESDKLPVPFLKIEFNFGISYIGGSLSGLCVV